jgi:hypothetical protein
VSPPIGAVRPVYVPFSGTADSKGNFTITLPGVRAIFWTCVKVIARVSVPASANWELDLNGAPADFANGPQMAIGPILVPPSSSLQIIGTGALAGSAIVGTVIGQEAADPADLSYTLAPSTISVATFQLTSKLTPDYVVAANTSDSRVVTISPGMQVLSIFPTVSAGSGTVQITVTGVQSGFIYFKANVGVAAGSVAAPLRILTDFSIDQSLTVVVDSTIAGHPTNPVTIRITGGPNPVDLVTANIQDSLGFTINAILGRDAANNVLLVSLSNANPAPWQAAQSSVPIASAIAAGNNIAGITAVAGKTIFLHTVNLNLDAASGGNDLRLYDGPVVNNVEIGRISGISTTPGYQDFKGRPLTISNGLSIQANGAAFTIRGTITFSQV